MIDRNESCTAGQMPMSYFTCLAYILKEWTGVEHIEDYLSYAVYLLWVFFPLIIVFLLPGVILLFIYISIIFVHIYKRKNELKEAYSNDFWDGAKQMLATLWDGHARIWHGYELHGIENIPEGPGLIVFYHGATPVDYIYFMAKLLILQKRTCHVVADHFVFKLPGFKLLLDVLGVMHGPKEECVNTLKKGQLLAISPGGVREALFSDETYVIMWGNRKGFAQVAIDAKVPVIPMFTQNVREGIRTLGGIKIFRSLYEHLRLPVVPMYGGFPVKLRTFIGEPIPYEPNVTAEELTAKLKRLPTLERRDARLLHKTLKRILYYSEKIIKVNNKNFKKVKRSVLSAPLDFSAIPEQLQSFFNQLSSGNGKVEPNEHVVFLILISLKSIEDT
ncbi:DGAT1/2-independent enzyme synthesizing storage lipids-like isoform X2 [Dromaius novaehollandiae]|nr:transmembrane protein 68-like isoform X2 [Dromaius novaehollandiae]XP_025953409.1 transmembrane protein 68-like isoform X2 [Dromaius novaehollandiae]XP_025953418.1 transmembrane protein 68-like isoform X2 [Dromaius novaehollandiae]